MNCFSPKFESLSKNRVPNRQDWNVHIPSNHFPPPPGSHSLGPHRSGQLSAFIRLVFINCATHQRAQRPSRRRWRVFSSQYARRKPRGSECDCDNGVARTEEWPRGAGLLGGVGGRGRRRRDRNTTWRDQCAAKPTLFEQEMEKGWRKGGDGRGWAVKGNKQNRTANRS